MTALPVLLLDLVCVLVFATVGRVSHAEALTAGGVLRTAWPFLVGATLGFVFGRGSRAPLALTSGLGVWAGAVTFGTLLRAWSGAGTPVSFVIVTAVVLAALLLGWRALANLVLNRRFRSRRQAQGTWGA